MRRFLFAVTAAICIFAPTAPAQAQMSGQRIVPLGYCQLATLSSAIGLSSCNSNVGIPSDATCVLMAAETAAIVFRDDGTSPTATVGLKIQPALQPWLYCGTLSALQFIAAAGSPVLDVLFYRIAG